MATKNRASAIIRPLLIFMLLFMLEAASAQSIQFDWVKALPHSYGNKLAIDSDKAIILLGDFSGTVDFDPGPGVFKMTAASAEDAYIAKYDSAGNFIWARQISSPAALFGYDIKLDKNGDLLILGGFNTSADFDPGPGTAILTSVYESSFLLRLDPNGNFVWVKALPNELNTIDIDPAGNIILGGSFSGTVDFDPGPGTYLASSTGGDFSFDLAVLKLDNAGNFVWMKQIRNLGTAQVQTWGLRSDPAGNILFAGNFTSTMDFDPGAGTVALTSAGNDDAFILKLDEDGNYQWVSQFGGAGSDKALGLEIDKYGNVYSTGFFQNSVDFDPGPGVFILSSDSVRSGYISKLDKNGHFIYAKCFQGGASMGQALALDSSNNLYITGNSMGVTDLDPGPGTFEVNAFCLFTVKLDSGGDFDWAAPYPSVGGPAVSSIYSAIKVDIMKNVYFTGEFAGTMDFDPTTGTYLISDPNGPGDYDTYLHKLSQCHNTLSLVSAESCDTFSLNGITYTSPGLYYQTLPNSVGCDSIVQLTLTRKEAFSLSTVTSCGAYSWNGRLLVSGGIYRDTFPSTTACDSVAELDLTLTNKISLVTETACGSYNWNGALLTATGTYSDTLHTAAGCDSIVALALVLLPKPLPLLGRDTVLCKGDTLRLFPGSFLSYTWNDNSNASALLVLDTGTYWVSVTDSSRCQASDTVRIMPSAQCGCGLGQGTKVYPAPFRDYLYIDKEHTSCEVSLDLYDILGQCVKKNILLQDGVNKIELLDLSPAIYVYRLTSGGKTLLTGKVVKLE